MNGVVECLDEILGAASPTQQLGLFVVRSFESNEPRTLARLEAFPLLSKLSYLNAPGEGTGAVGIGFVSLLTAVCMPSGRGETK